MTTTSDATFTGPMALRATFLALAVLAAALLGWGAVAYAQADRPDRPTGVTASVDTDTGHVVISWDAPGSTIAKHRVFRRNRTAGEAGLTRIGNAVRNPDTSAFPGSHTDTSVNPNPRTGTPTGSRPWTPAAAGAGNPPP